MPLTRPVVGADISAADFGQPVYDLVYPSAWAAMPFAANWQNYANFQPCVYRKIGTRVEFRGVAQRKGSIVAANVTATLFTGMVAANRPPVNMLVAGIAGFATPVLARLDINSNGDITVQPSGDIPIDGFVGFSGVWWTD